MPKIIVELRAGSHLYGTATARSDLDLKAVYLPNGRDILLQRVQPSRNTAARAGGRNLPGTVDHEAFSLQRYLELLAGGQSVALDMLFAPDSAMTREPAPLWREIQAMAPSLVSRRAGMFLRYCRQQARKFGARGTRLAACRAVLDVLTEAEAALGTRAPLSDAAARLDALVAHVPGVALKDIPTQSGGVVRHLVVSGKSIPCTATVRLAADMMRKQIADYGQRALEAEANQGIDWKALSHAVRVGHQAIELFTTGRIVFPLASAPHLLAIKVGHCDHDSVSAEIDDLLAQVEAAAAQSSLPDEPDHAAIDALVARVYRAQVLADT